MAPWFGSHSSSQDSNNHEGNDSATTIVDSSTKRSSNVSRKLSKVFSLNNSTTSSNTNKTVKSSISKTNVTPTLGSTSTFASGDSGKNPTFSLGLGSTSLFDDESTFKKNILEDESNLKHYEPLDAKLDEGDFDSVYKNKSLAAAIIAHNSDVDKNKYTKTRSRSNSVSKYSVMKGKPASSIPEDSPIHYISSTYHGGMLSNNEDIDEITSIGVYGSSLVSAKSPEFANVSQAIINSNDAFNEDRYSSSILGASVPGASIISPTDSFLAAAENVDIDTIISASCIESKMVEHPKLAHSPSKKSLLGMFRSQSSAESSNSLSRTTSAYKSDSISQVGSPSRSSVKNTALISNDTEQLDIDQLLSWDPQPFAEIAASIPNKMIDVSDLVDDGEYEVAYRRYSTTHAYEIKNPDKTESSTDTKAQSTIFRRQRCNTISQMQRTGEIEKVTAIANTNTIQRLRRGSIGERGIADKYHSSSKSGSKSYVLGYNDTVNIKSDSLTTYGIPYESANGEKQSCFRDVSIVISSS